MKLRSFLFKYMKKDTIGAEIGVARGKFSQRILESTKPKKLHLIDPWLCYTDEEHKKAGYGSNKATQDKMDRCRIEVQNKFAKDSRVEIHHAKSAEIADSFPDEYFDWIYIDGDHTYDGVKADLEAYYPKVKVKGLILGDDYVDEGWWEDGVRRAVKEFINKASVQVVEIKEKQFILKKIE